MMQVLIRNLRLFAHHGVLPQERTVGAYFIINLRIQTDFSRAMDTDELDGTISYADVFEVVKAEMAVPSRLLEHVAGRICRAILHRFPTAVSVHLELLKENPPMGADCAGAGVVLEMSA
ncbi:MAG: dihydroneopterin aldolase [Bacteroidaceae bacterium]|nr:dihydroneopterin aldolase [Bacteroidaceae bacterium]